MSKLLRLNAYDVELESVPVSELLSLATVGEVRGGLMQIKAWAVTSEATQCYNESDVKHLFEWVEAVEDRLRKFPDEALLVEVPNRTLELFEQIVLGEYTVYRNSEVPMREIPFVKL